MPIDDDQLLCSYAAHRSEAAFRELVRRHAAIVHGVAHRQAGIDVHLADDVTQRVFITLARKAGILCGQASLVGWLYTAARLEAARAVRTEARRRNWEEKAGAMNHTQAEEPVEQIPWEQLRRVLDEAMAQLGETDRQAVLLRFFSGRSFGEVGRGFQISEDAARKRVERALDKLRDTLGRRGIVSTSAALSTALGAHAAPAVADGALATIAAGAWQHASMSSALPFGLFISSTKITATVAGAVILLAATAVIRDAVALPPDPELQRMQVQAFVSDQRLRFAALFKRLVFTPEKLQAFDRIESACQHVMLDRTQTEVARQQAAQTRDAQLKELFGADHEQWIEANRQHPARAIVARIVEQTFPSAGALTTAQADELTHIVAQHRVPPSKEPGVSQPRYDWDRFITDANVLLADRQQAAFVTAIAYRRASDQMSAMAAKKK